MTQSKTRFIRVTAYVSERVDNGRGGRNVIVHRHRVLIDTYSIEAASVPAVGPANFTIHMASGKTWDIEDEDYDRIEKMCLMREGD